MAKKRFPKKHTKNYYFGNKLQPNWVDSNPIIPIFSTFLEFLFHIIFIAKRNILKITIFGTNHGKIRF